MGTKKDSLKKSYKISLSQNTINNFEEITGFIAFIQHQPQNAIKVGDKIFETIDRIGANPLQFKTCEEIPKKYSIYRKAICQSWLIIFKIMNEKILILGIIHASRNPNQIKSLKK